MEARSEQLEQKSSMRMKMRSLALPELAVIRPS